MECAHALPPHLTGKWNTTTLTGYNHLNGPRKLNESAVLGKSVVENWQTVCEVVCRWVVQQKENWKRKENIYGVCGKSFSSSGKLQKKNEVCEMYMGGMIVLKCNLCDILKCKMGNLCYGFRLT